jgi:hypothetical protein
MHFKDNKEGNDIAKIVHGLDIRLIIIYFNLFGAKDEDYK